jgi:cardiolipin synthase
MTQRGARLAKHGCPAARRLWPACALVLVVGCQIPAAHVTCDDPLPGVPHRIGPLACQFAADTTVELVHHPLRCAWELVYGLADELWGTAHGEVGKRLVLPLLGPPPPLGCDPLACLAPGPPGGLVGRDLQPACVRIYPDGAEALAALEEIIDGATCSLDVLMFEWEEDRVGQTIAHRLAAKAGPNLRVRVLVDGGGNLIFGRPFDADVTKVNHALAVLAQAPYVEVLRTRNPFFRFDHRKLVLADRCRGWMGGRNLVARSFYEQRDLSFTVAGPLGADLADLYERFWREQGGKGDCQLPIANCQLKNDGQVCNPQCAIAANAWARLVQTAPADHDFQRALYDAVDRARHYVLAENIYFTDSRLVYKLAQARHRGVDVRVVLTVTSTSLPFNRANRVTANRLLRAGVRIYLYPGMTHAKAAAVDGCWAYVGTANFDPLSLRHNHELGLIIGAGPVIQELEERQFQPAFCPAWELTTPLPVGLGDYVCEWLASWWL